LGHLHVLGGKVLDAVRRLRRRKEDAEAESLTRLKEHLEQRIKMLDREAALLQSALIMVETYIDKATPPALRVAESVRSLLPEEARLKVSVQETETSFHLKIPYGVLSRQQFASVTRLVESMQGRWVSAGRDSHWEVPKRKET